MEIKKLLACAAIALGCGSVWAQTDVTNLLKNPSFEAYGEAKTLPNATGETIAGWTLPNLGNDYTNVSIGDALACNGQGCGIPAAASDGNLYFFNRKGWGTQAAELSQTVNLPAGKYFITVDYKAYERSTTNGTVGFSINGTSVFSTKPYMATSANNVAVNDPWKTLGAWFTVETEGDVKIAITENLVGGAARADLYLDNVKLYKWDLDDETNYKAASDASPLDVTAKFVTNPYFDNNVDGWTTTTGYQNKGRATNQGGVISGGFFENWNQSAKESGKMSYTATGLPSGTYRVTMAVFANNETPGLKIFAGEVLTGVSKTGLYSVEGSTKTGSLEFGLELSAGNTANWIGIDNVRLELLELSNEIDLTPWNDAKAAAQTAIADYNDFYGTPEYTDIVDKINAYDPVSIDQMTEMVTALNNAVAAYKAAVANDKMEYEKEDFVSGYNAMKEKYSETLETKFAGSCGTASGQHWSGDDSSRYADTWSASATTKANTCTITLPKGEYAFVAAGRGQAGTTPSISVKVGEADATVLNYTAKGDTGYGIATDGSASYEWRDDEFANNGTGRGWEWGYIEFSLTEDTEVTLSYGYTLINGSWASITDAALLCTSETKEEAEYAAELAAAKNELRNAIDNKPTPTANIYGQSDNYMTWAQEIVEEIISQKAVAEDLIANSTDIEAIENAVFSLDGIPYMTSAPECDTPLNVIMAKEGLGWTGNAVTFTYSEGNQNKYAMAYSEVAGESNFNQTVYFDEVENEALVNMYIIDAEGKKWYVTDGTHVGSTVSWAGSQLRMTDVAEDAMPIVIMPSFDKEGVCELINYWTDEHIGSTNNNGFYCSNDNYELAIKPAAKKEIEIKVAEYGTVILPADVDNVFNSAKFYSVNSLDGNEVVLTEEGDVLKANTPYIVENQNGFGDASITLGCYANAFKSSYTNGLLTGVYTETLAPVDSYVLQTQNGAQAFYKVAEGKQPKLAPNKAYLTAPAATEAKLNIANATAIKAIDALVNGSAKIYDINGRQINKLQKGVNIVNGVKVMVK